MKTPAFINKLLTDYFRFLAGGLVLVILVFGYLALLAPKFTAIRTSELMAQKNVSAELTTQQQYADDLRRSNEQFAATLTPASRQLIDTFLPSEADFPGLMLTAKDVVTRAQLTLDSITVGQGGSSPTAPKPSAPATGETATGESTTTAVGGVSVKTQDVSLTVSGGTSYVAFKNFLRLLESSQRLFDVTSVNFSTAASTPGQLGQTPVSWSLVLRTYYLPISP